MVLQGLECSSCHFDQGSLVGELWVDVHQQLYWAGTTHFASPDAATADAAMPQSFFPRSMRK